MAEAADDSIAFITWVVGPFLLKFQSVTVALSKFVLPTALSVDDSSDAEKVQKFKAACKE